ncbi:MAG: endonuclease/exonuclease/phosphatase family protein [Leifsonia sp.]
MTDAPLIGPVAAPELQVMSFNIRRRMPKVSAYSPDHWSNRRGLVQRILAAEQPTILGAQEALADQVGVLAAGLGPHYGWVGEGRNADRRGERNLLFYDTERLTLTGWRQRALSDTPDRPGSRSWGNRIPRIVVSAEFTDIPTGRRVIAFTTHFDHQVPAARWRSAEMIVDLVAEAHAAEPDAAIVVTGDVNADVDSAVYRRLTASGVLRDSWEAADTRLTPQWGTFSDYAPLRRGGKRIDLILVGPGVDVVSAGINVTRFDGAAASDHEPVQAVLRYPPKAVE